MAKKEKKTRRPGKELKKPLLTTEQAFEELFQKNLLKYGAHRMFRGISSSEMRNIRRRFRMGVLSIEKKEWLLSLSGYKVAQVKLWY